MFDDGNKSLKAECRNASWGRFNPCGNTDLNALNSGFSVPAIFLCCYRDQALSVFFVTNLQLSSLLGRACVLMVFWFFLGAACGVSILVV